MAGTDAYEMFAIHSYMYCYTFIKTHLIFSPGLGHEAQGGPQWNPDAHGLGGESGGAAQPDGDAHHLVDGETRGCWPFLLLEELVKRKCKETWQRSEKPFLVVEIGLNCVFETEGDILKRIYLGKQRYVIICYFSVYRVTMLWQI